MSWTGEGCSHGLTDGLTNGAPWRSSLEAPALHWEDCAHTARLHSSPLLRLPLLLDVCSDDPDAVDPKARLRWDNSSSSSCGSAAQLG